MNRAIELHDSRVELIERVGDDLVVQMKAYVHESEGRPGIDPGTGWTQPVRITVSKAFVRNEPDSGHLWILDGVVRTDSATFNNVLPIALEAKGAVEIEFAGAEGELIVVGSGIRVEGTGEATYVEGLQGGKE